MAQMILQVTAHKPNIRDLQKSNPYLLLFFKYVDYREMYVDMETREDVKWRQNLHKIGLSFMHLTT